MDQILVFTLQSFFNPHLVIILFLQWGNPRDIQMHLIPFPVELSVLKVFPSAINEWNKVDPEICRSGCYNIFQKQLLKFIRPCVNKICSIYYLVGIKFLTRLHLGFSHLQEHKYKRHKKRKACKLFWGGQRGGDDDTAA